jgi:quercetin dioxygenase-like cupin family protein
MQPGHGPAQALKPKNLMEKIVTNRVLLITTIIVAFCVADQSHAQDPMEVSPNIYTVLFEDDEIRVMEITYEPGEHDLLHSHPRYTVIAKEGGTLRVHVAGAAPEDHVIQADQPSLLDAVEAHWGENVGNTTIRAIAVEFKKSPAK